MSDLKSDQRTYSLDTGERRDIIDNSVDNMSNKLSGYQMNSEMKTAWISKIVPPKADENVDIDIKDDEIAVQFLLPSDDVFWEKFNLPDMRWPEDNEFRQFMENIGYYNPNDLSEMVGSTVDIIYNESKNTWVTNVEPEPSKREKFMNSLNNLKPDEEALKKVLSYTVLGVAVFASLFLVVVLKHIGLIIAIIILVGVYIILNN